jgi:adenylate kinase family enzyme
MEKIIVIGTTGSGKSTLAKALVKKINAPYIQLDQLFWKPNWERTDDEEFLKELEDSIKQSRWIVDGNYTRTRHITWKEADTIIWVDLPFWLTFYQNLTRTIKRSALKKEIWKGTGNRESFRRMFSKDSILIWLLKTYSKNIEKYESALEDPEYSHINFIRLKSRKEVDLFIKNINTVHTS